MMNEPELFAAAESLAEAMVQRGMNTPDVRVMATSSGDARVEMYWSSAVELYNDRWKYFTGDNLTDACAKAAAYLAALPIPKTIAMQNHMTRVADCIDKGRAAGLDDAYIAPLVVVKAAMAKNLLAAPVAS